MHQTDEALIPNFDLVELPLEQHLELSPLPPKTNDWFETWSNNSE